MLQIMTAKDDALRPRRFKSMIFPQMIYDIVLYAWHFLPAKFFRSIALINYVSSYLKMSRGPTISTIAGINGVRLAHRLF